MKGNWTLKELVLILVLFALAIGFAYYVQNFGIDLKNSEIAEVCIGENCFEVEVVDAPEERARGLMFRESLDRDKGMLFVFEEEGVYPFWMKNTLIPLDMIWISSNREIVFIARDVQPCKQDPCPNIDPKEEALFVLEINGGLSQEMGIVEGNSVKFK